MIADRSHQRHQLGVLTIQAQRYLVGLRPVATNHVRFFSRLKLQRQTEKRWSGLRVAIALIMLAAALAYSVYLVAPALAAQTGGKKITVNFVNADPVVILSSMFEQAGVNYALSLDVKGRLTVHIKNKTLRQALDAVLFPLGLTATESGGVYVVEKAVAPAKRKPALFSNTPQKVVVTLKRSPSDTSVPGSVDQNNAQTPTYDQQVAMAMRNYQSYGPYSNFSPSGYYSMGYQTPGLTVLPQYHQLPLVIGQQPWGGPSIYGTGFMYYNPQGQSW